MSLEKRGDRDDVSTLGANGDWTMSGNPPELAGCSGTRSTFPRLLGGRHVGHGREMFRSVYLQCPRLRRAEQHQALLS